MTSKERIKRVFEHKETDRIPILEGPWRTTVERWREEGMGEQDFTDYFDLDRMAQVGGDCTPRYEQKVIEDSDDYCIRTNQWGATLRVMKDHEAGYEILDTAVKDRNDWEKMKDRYAYADDRVNWQHLEENWPKWQEAGIPAIAGGQFGFDYTHARFLGTECTLIALIEDPDWIIDVWNTQLDLAIEIWNHVWEKGYHFDLLCWADDLGYKQSQFFSMDVYHHCLKPIHKRAIDWAHDHGIPACLHSCGDIRPFVPEFVEIGFDGLNPLEVKAGVDPIAIKEQYGDKLALHGGFNTLLWNDLEKFKEAIARDLPKLVEGGGYIFATDHSVPSNVSLENFREITSLVKSF